MRRNFIGSTLAVLLLAVIATKQIVLGFCLCDASYFVDACACHAETAAPACEADCCHEEQHPELPAEPDHSPNDCDETVSLDSGDFLWSQLADLHPSFAVADLPPYSLTEVKFPRTGETLRSSVSPRGSPPSTNALYLRHQSFRL